MKRRCPYCAEEIQDAAIKCRWCGSDLTAPRSAARTPEPGPHASTHSLSLTLTVIGAAAIVIAPFLVWVRVVLLGNLNLFNLINTAHSAWIWAVVPMGAAGLALLVRKTPLTIIAALIAGGIDGLLLIALLHDVRNAYGFAQVGVGPWVGVGGAVLLFVGGVAATGTPAGDGFKAMPVSSVPTRATVRPAQAADTLTGAVHVDPEARPEPKRAVPKPNWRKRIVVAVAALVVVVAAIAGGFLLAHRSNDTASATLPTTTVAPASGAQGSTGAPQARSASTRSAALTLRQPPNGGYSLLLPGNWSFRDASYPSDHATHLWWLPGNALKKAEIVISGCVGCVSKNEDATTPYPEGELPAGASTYKISPWKLAYEVYTGDDPYPDNGLIIVTRSGGRITGSFRIDLWLPQAEHHLALRS